MDYLAENMRYLIWASRRSRRGSEQSYAEFIDELSARCQIDADRFRMLLSGTATASFTEVEQIKSVFSSVDEERVPYIDCEYLFRPFIEENSELLIMENLRYLLHSIPWGDNQDFIDAMQIRASTLTRWKSGKMKPSRYYKEKICQYFGIPGVDSLKSAFLFLGLSPATTLEKKLHLKRMIDKIDRERLETMYPAIVRLLE